MSYKYHLERKENMSYKYHLAKKGKTNCPNCGRKTFVLYVDEYNNPLNPNVGKCDRADNCNYHYPPRQYFADGGIVDEYRPIIPKTRIPQPIVPPSYIDKEILKNTMQNGSNNFVEFLNKLIGKDGARKVVNKYYIGSWEQATVFWQIDRFGNVHTGKIMLYDPTTGKRVKTDPNTGEKRNYVTWVHTAMKMPQYNLVQCLFGEHLLKDVPDACAVIVESEKTAAILSYCCNDDDVIWLACGGCQNLSKQICEPLKGREIYLLPDNGKFEEWKKKGRDLLEIGSRVFISDIMEREATNSGDDICDYVIKLRSPNLNSNYKPEFELDFEQIKVF